MIDQPSLLTRLQDSNLLKPAGDTEAQIPAPWYIKVLMAACGWLAAIFTLAFFGLAIVNLFDSPIAMFVLGTVLIVGAYFLLGSSEAEFTEHLGLAISLAGQAMIAFALFSDDNSDTAFNWAVLLIIQSGLAFIMHSFAHRMISAYFAAGCLAMLLNTLSITSVYSGLLLLIAGMIWQSEFAFGRSIRKLQAIGYGLVLALIQLKTTFLFASHGRTWGTVTLPELNPWLDETLNVLVLMYLVYRMVKLGTLQIPRSHKQISVVLLSLLCVMTFFANGVAVGIAIVLMGYVASNRVLLALGMISALINLSSYYYLIDVSLLHKSIILASLGGAAMLLYMALSRLDRKRTSADG